MLSFVTGDDPDPHPSAGIAIAGEARRAAAAGRYFRFATSRLRSTIARGGSAISSFARSESSLRLGIAALI